MMISRPPIRRRSLSWIVALLIVPGAAARAGDPAAADSLSAVSSRLEGGAGSAKEYAALGESYRRAGQVDRAMKAYEKAVSMDRSDVGSRLALGRIYLDRAVGKGLKPMQYRRRAMLMARQMQEADASFAPADLLLGLCYEWLEGDAEQALKHYERYLARRPADAEGLLGLGRVCLDLRRFGRIQEVLIPFADRHPEETGLLPVLAQADLLHRRPEQALSRFRRYLETLDPAERTLYEDVRTIASAAEAEAFQALPPDERPAFLRRFWQNRDADILTEISEGEVEHYRRVWYARTYFGRIVRPWDRRGEVYLRYGEPDSRARAGRMDAVQSADVQRVKERLAQTLYGTASQEVTYSGTVFPIKSLATGTLTLAAPLDKIITNPGSIVPRIEDVENYGAAAAEQGIDLRSSANDALPSQVPKGGSITYAPVTTAGDQSALPWESWVYVNVGGGIEITFTDELNNGVYGYAPIPPIEIKDERALTGLSRLTANSPEALVASVASVTPSAYRLARAGEALGFYYDTADYRGEEGRTRLEIAYGLPTKEVKVMDQGDSVTVAVERAVALATPDRSRVYRIHEGTALVGKGAFLKQKGEFIPDLVKLEAPPGEYELAVQIVDRVSGRAGIYKQAITLKPYSSESLELSDIALAFSVGDRPAGEAFRKGDVWVLPMPTRSYGAGQSAAAYYEVYNLRQDDRGHTRYKVEYSIRSAPDEGEDPISIAIAGLKRFVRTRKPQVAVTYTRAGSAPQDAGYLTLDLKRARPGRNILRVAVTDLVGGGTAKREVAFRCAK